MRQIIEKTIDVALQENDRLFLKQLILCLCEKRSYENVVKALQDLQVFLLPNANLPRDRFSIVWEETKTELLKKYSPEELFVANGIFRLIAKTNNQ